MTYLQSVPSVMLEAQQFNEIALHRLDALEKRLDISNTPRDAKFQT